MDRKVEFRKANVADIDGVAELYDSNVDKLLATFNYPGWMKDIYPARVTAVDAVAEGSLFVLEDKTIVNCGAKDSTYKSNNIIATAILRVEKPEFYDRAEWDNEIEYMVIHTLAVHPDYQGKGFGSVILDEIIKYAKTIQINCIRVDVYEDNTPAARMYEKASFVERGKVDLGRGNIGLDWFYMYELMI